MFKTDENILKTIMKSVMDMIIVYSYFVFQIQTFYELLLFE